MFGCGYSLERLIPKNLALMSIFFFWYRESHQITPTGQGGAAVSRLLLTKNPVCFLSCPSCRGTWCLV